MFKGYPGETAEDLELTARFLDEHVECIDRIRFNEFSILEGTPVHTAMREEPAKFPQLKILDFEPRHANARYVNVDSASRAYRRAKSRVLDAVYAINRRPVRRNAQAFDGLM
jgi:radical SAM superfamily enzyme YgiQ (UPF0313 family)